MDATMMAKTTASTTIVLRNGKRVSVRAAARRTVAIMQIPNHKLAAAMMAV
jgi:hypothetical protein